MHALSRVVRHSMHRIQRPQQSLWFEQPTMPLLARVFAVQMEFIVSRSWRLYLEVPTVISPKGDERNFETDLHNVPQVFKDRFEAKRRAMLLVL